jgi:hypothetical protein
MMKSTIIILSILLLGSLFFIPSTQAEPSIMIANYSVVPEILMPGDTAILTLHVANGETVATQSSTYVSGGESTTTTRTLGTTIESIRILPVQIGGRQIYATAKYEDVGYLAAASSIMVNFKLVVDANMSEGLYFPIVEVDVSSGTDVQYPLLLKVSNASVDLLPKSIPSKISSGGTTELVVTVVNKRDNPVKEVIITPEGENVEFVPQSYFLGSLPAETSQDIVFSVKPHGLGEGNLFFHIGYKNGDNLHTSALEVPITIIEALDVAPIITNFPISISKTGSSRISIEVYNAKTETITGVLVTPLCDATVIPSQYFIGSMDPDDVFSASFDIYPSDLEYGTHTIGFLVSFKQGNDYYETPVVSKAFSVVSGPGVSYGSSASSTEGSGSNNLALGSSLLTCLTPLLIVIVVVIVFILFYVRWKKRRKAS